MDERVRHVLGARCASEVVVRDYRSESRLVSGVYERAYRFVLDAELDVHEVGRAIRNDVPHEVDIVIGSELSLPALTGAPKSEDKRRAWQYCVERLAYAGQLAEVERLAGIVGTPFYAVCSGGNGPVGAGQQRLLGIVHKRHYGFGTSCSHVYVLNYKICHAHPFGRHDSWQSCATIIPY